MHHDTDLALAVHTGYFRVNIPDIYLGGAWFKSQLRHQLSWQVFHTFLQPLEANNVLGHDWFLAEPFQFIIQCYSLNTKTIVNFPPPPSMNSLWRDGQCPWTVASGHKEHIFYWSLELCEHLWRWYISTNIMFLDNVHHPVFIQNTVLYQLGPTK
jgi:hypothetical protein